MAGVYRCQPYDGDFVLLPRANDSVCESYHEWFDGKAATSWAGNTWWLPLTLALLYVVLLAAPRPKTPVIGRTPVFVWNVTLAMFSAWGTLVCCPKLLAKVSHAGLRASICDDVNWFGNDSMGLAMFAFTLSKLAELMDTIFLVLRARPVPYLHWYHHLSVLIYTWHAFATRTSTGAWFASINYFIHTFMYSYYALVQIQSVRPFAFAVANMITRLQIGQMVMGIAIASAAVCWRAYGVSCNHSPLNTKFAMLIYASYFALFVSFYTSKMQRKKNEEDVKKTV